MSLSRLLLVAASSKKYIVGDKGKDQLVIKPRDFTNNVNDPWAGEVVLCFQIDDPENGEFIANNLDIKKGQKRCDGLIFFAQDGQVEKTICLVEMKSSNTDEAAKQITKTKDHIESMLQKECGISCHKPFSKIKWKACLFNNGASQDDINTFKNQLKNGGFDKVDVFAKNDNDVGPFLREETSSKKSKAQVQRRNRHR